MPGRFVTTVATAASFDPNAPAGRKVAVRRESSHQEFVRRYLPGAQLVAFDSEFLALDALERGEVDAFFGDALRASFWLNTHIGCCEFVGAPYFRPDLFGEGMAIALPAGHDAVRQAIDSGLTRLKRSGALDELYLRWFPVSFY
jgi:polar amino acid transport system substrate-binding protein